MGMKKYWDSVFAKVEVMSCEEVVRLLEDSGFIFSGNSVDIEYDIRASVFDAVSSEGYYIPISASPLSKDLLINNPEQNVLFYNEDTLAKGEYTIQSTLQRAA